MANSRAIKLNEFMPNDIVSSFCFILKRNFTAELPSGYVNGMRIIVCL